MRHPVYTAAAVAVALSAPASRALAQQYPGYSYRPAYSTPGYNGGGISRQRTDRALFDHVRIDLDRAAAYPASRSDRKRFDDARRDLFDFQSRFDQGLFDKHTLGHAIDRLQSVFSHNSLDPRDRDILAEDLRQLRDYREFRARASDPLRAPNAYRP